MSHPIIVTVSGETVDEVRAKLVQLAVQFGHDDKQEALPLPPVGYKPGLNEVSSAAALNQAAAPAPEKPRRGRPPAAEKSPTTPPAESAAPTQQKVADTTAAATATATATKDQVIAALQGLQTAINLKAVIEVLGKYGAKKASEVKAEDYASVVAECNRQMAAAATLTA